MSVKIFHGVLKFALLILLGVILFPQSLFNPPGLGLDNSWPMALHLAIDENLIFGKDIIFTYGPLGYLITRLPVGISKLSIVLFDTYLLGVAIWAMFLILKEHRSIQSYAIGLLTVFLVGTPFTYDLVFFMSWLLLFNMFYFIKDEQKIHLLSALVLTTILFFVKVNVGIIVIFLLTSFLIYQFLCHKLNGFTLFAYLALQYVMLLGASFLFNVDLSNYFISSLNILVGYNDSMYRLLEETKNGEIYLNSAICILLISLLSVVIQIRHLLQNRGILFVTSFVLLFLFLLFKQSFVRADEIHISSFFSYAPLYFALIPLYAVSKDGRVFSSILLLFIISLSFFNWYKLNDELKVNYSSFKPTAQLKKISDYFNGIFVADSDLLFVNARNSRVIPREILNKISDAGVDIVPHEISYIGLNDLVYNPRPIIQSYSAYNRYLMGKNYRKYVSDSAPEYVFFSGGTIDYRYPFWDDAMVKMALLTHYELIIPNEDCFDEDFYLTEYEDVRNAVNSGAFTNGAEHFLQYGRREGRRGAFVNFLIEESEYLYEYPDVAGAIRKGVFASGQEHYEMQGFREDRKTSGVAMLFEKRKLSRELKIVNEWSIAGTLNQEINIPETNNLLFMRMKVKNSIFGWLKKMLFQPDALVVEFLLEDGSRISRKAIVPILNCDLLVNFKVETNQDAYNFYKMDGVLNLKVIGLTFHASSPSEWNPTLDITWIEKRIVK